MSPFELNYHKVAHEQSRDIFIDAFECLSAALTNDTFSYSGPHFTYANVPMPLRPLQQPCRRSGTAPRTPSAPPGPASAHAFRRQRADRSCQGQYRSVQGGTRQRGGAASPKPNSAAGPWSVCCVGSSSPTPTRRARRIAKPNVEYHLASLDWLRRKHSTPQFTARGQVPRGANFEECVADGTAIAGSPDTVCKTIERQAAELGINYLLTYLFLGAMSLNEALRSLQLFSTEVMPKLAQL